MTEGTGHGWHCPAQQPGTGSAGQRQDDTTRRSSRSTGCTSPVPRSISTMWVGNICHPHLRSGDRGLTAHREDQDLQVGVLLQACTCIRQLGSPRKHGQGRGHKPHSTQDRRPLALVISLRDHNHLPGEQERPKDAKHRWTRREFAPAATAEAGMAWLSGGTRALGAHII